jgi:hypothetical protein
LLASRLSYEKLIPHHSEGDSSQEVVQESGVQEFRSSEVQKFRSSGVQKFRRTVKFLPNPGYVL